MEMEFGTKLLLLRTEQKLSQEALADKIGVSKSTVSNWHKGEYAPDLREAVQLANLFGVSVEYLARDEIEDRNASGPVTTDDERLILRTVRALKLGVEEAIGRLHGAEAKEEGEKIPGKLIRVRSLPGDQEPRSESKSKRKDRGSANGEDVPPRRR